MSTNPPVRIQASPQATIRIQERQGIRGVRVAYPGLRGIRGERGEQGEGLGNHLAAENPHPQYLTQEEADALYGDNSSNKATDLSVANRTANDFTLVSSSGDDAILPPATSTQAGLATAGQVQLIEGAIQEGDGRLIDAREWTADEVSQAESEEGSSATPRKWSSLRVRQGVQAWWNNVLLAAGKIPATYLPSYVDDVIEVANNAARPIPGETGKIYITLNDNKQHRWTGSTYITFESSPGSTDAVAEGSVNLYFTAARAIAAVTWGTLTGIPSWIASSGVFGRSFVASADQAAGRTALGLDTAAYQPAGAFATAAQGVKADSAIQPGNAALSDARDWTASEVDQPEAEAGTATTPRKWSSLRVRQNVQAWWAGSAAKAKLDDIQAGATANDTNAQLRDRTTHTGEQAISTITGLSSALGVKADLVGGVIPTSQIPSVALVEFLGAVANQGALLLLRGQPGDWAIRTDRATQWVIVANNGASLADWYEMPTGIAPVGSVNGRTGSVVLGTGDLSETGGNLWFTNARVAAAIPWAAPGAIGGTTPSAGTFTQLTLPAQGSAPSTPGSGFSLYANSSNALSWIGANGYTRTFDGTANTANRTYTLPDASGTFALQGAAGSFTTLSASTSLLLPSAASGSPAAGHVYRVTDTLRYRDSGNVEKILLNSSDNLSNLASPSTALANLAGMPLTFASATITYAATVDLDMAALTGLYRTISLTGNLTFTTSNRAAGRTVVLRLICDGTKRTLTFPAGWVFLSDKPANIEASKSAALSLTFYGTADTDCLAAYKAQS